MPNNWHPNKGEQAVNINLKKNRNFRATGVLIAAFATLGTAACGGAAELVESQPTTIAPSEQDISDTDGELDNMEELEEVVSALQDEVDRLQTELNEAQEAPSEPTTEETSTSSAAATSATETTAQAEERVSEEIVAVAASPEVEGEDCDEVKDLSRYTLDVSGDTEVIANDLANSGDVCDFYSFEVDGLDNSNIRSGVLRFVLSCDEEDRFIEANNQGRGGFDWRVGGPDGVKYQCGDSWEQSVYYQSYRKSVAIYVNPARGEGSADYQLTVIATPN